MTSPPLVAASRSSSTSTLADQLGNGNRAAGEEEADDGGDKVTELVSPTQAIKRASWHGGPLSPRSIPNELDQGPMEQLPLPSPGWRTIGAPSAGSGRRSFEILERPNDRPVRHSFRGVFEEDDPPAPVSDERGHVEPDELTPDSALSGVGSPFLSSMSLHSVGRGSSVSSNHSPLASSSRAHTPTLAPNQSSPRSRPPLRLGSPMTRSPDPGDDSEGSPFERGHKTMLSSGSVRSIGRRTSVNSAASLSPSIREDGMPLPGSSPSSTPVLLPQMAAVVNGSSSGSSTAAPTPPGPALTPVQGAAPTIPTSGEQVHALLAHLLPPAAVRYPRAPGHDSPHAFEEGCSRAPSPRPTNHYRHEREGGEWRPGKEAAQVLEELRDEPGTPKRPLEAAQEKATPRWTGEPMASDETPRPAKPATTSPVRPGFAASTTSPPSTLPRSAPSSSLQSSPSDDPHPNSRPASPPRSRSSALPRNASFTNQTTRPSIASAIRERRRQASLFAAAAASGGGSFTGSRTVSRSSIADDTSPSPTPDPWRSPTFSETAPVSPTTATMSPDPAPTRPANRRMRSRGPSRMGGLADLGPGDDFRTFGGGLAGSRVSSSSSSRDLMPESLVRALHKGLEMGMLGDVVMTPTTEEWRQLGGLPGEMRKFRDDPQGEEEASSSDEDDSDEGHPDDSVSMRSDSTPARSDLTSALRLDRLPMPDLPRPDDVPTPTQEPPGFMPTSSSLTMTQLHQTPVHGFIESAHPDPDMKSMPMLSAMSSSSIVSTTSSGGESNVSSAQSMIFPPISPRAIRQGVPLCSLLHDGIVQGPVDPRVYSAVTGRRTIDSFVVQGEAGKGAYGMVRRAREKGPDGQPVGPDLIIKYIVKQKILADCWKKHRVLGPIPIEIHVLDHLRRVPFRPSLVHKPRRRPPSRRQSGFGVPDPLANGDPRTGHPNICGILDYFEDADYYYMVMPCFGEGQDLFDYVDLAPDGLPLAEVRSMFGQVVDATAFLHEHHIVHRDIKDENVIMDGFGNVQLIDFGSAAYVRDGKLFDTFSGTLDFAAPEVLRGERHGGKEIDVWALGVLLYVLVCGECPFWSSSEAAQGIERETRAYKALEAKVRSLAADKHRDEKAGEGKGASDGEEEEASPEDALDLVARCLAIDVRERPSAHEVCSHRFLAGKSGGWVGRAPHA